MRYLKVPLNVSGALWNRHATVASFGCRCEVCAEPQAGGADAGEGQQSSDGAHSTATPQTLGQVRPAAAAPA